MKAFRRNDAKSASLKADSIKWCMSLGRVTFSLGFVVPRAVSNKSARRNNEAARRSDEAQEKSDLMPPKSAYAVHPCGRQKPAGKNSEETAKTGQPCE